MVSLVKIPLEHALLLDLLLLLLCELVDTPNLRVDLDFVFFDLAGGCFVHE